MTYNYEANGNQESGFEQINRLMVGWAADNLKKSETAARVTDL